MSSTVLRFISASILRSDSLNRFTSSSSIPTSWRIVDVCSFFVFSTSHPRMLASFSVGSVRKSITLVCFAFESFLSSSLVSVTYLKRGLLSSSPSGSGGSSSSGISSFHEMRTDGDLNRALTCLITSHDNPYTSNVLLSDW